MKHAAEGRERVEWARTATHAVMVWAPLSQRNPFDLIPAAYRPPEPEPNELRQRIKTEMAMGAMDHFFTQGRG